VVPAHHMLLRIGNVPTLGMHGSGQPHLKLCPSCQRSSPRNHMMRHTDASSY
jgi:hypothetical protein